MHIVCPHCTTSYAVNPASFGGAGRKVRCSRCKETWLAHPEELARAEALAPSMAAAAGSGADPDAAGWGDTGQAYDGEGQDSPMVDSPSISSDWPTANDQTGDNRPPPAQDGKERGASSPPLP